MPHAQLKIHKRVVIRVPGSCTIEQLPPTPGNIRPIPNRAPMSREVAATKIQAAFRSKKPRAALKMWKARPKYAWNTDTRKEPLRKVRKRQKRTRFPTTKIKGSFLYR